MLLFYWPSNTIVVELGRNEDDYHLGGCFHLISIILVRKTALISIFLFLEGLYVFWNLFPTSCSHFNRRAWDLRSWISQYIENSVQHCLPFLFYFRLAHIFFLFDSYRGIET